MCALHMEHVSKVCVPVSLVTVGRTAALSPSKALVVPTTALAKACVILAGAFASRATQVTTVPLKSPPLARMTVQGMGIATLVNASVIPDSTVTAVKMIRASALTSALRTECAHMASASAFLAGTVRTVISVWNRQLWCLPLSRSSKRWVRKVARHLVRKWRVPNKIYMPAPRMACVMMVSASVKLDMEDTIALKSLGVS